MKGLQLAGDMGGVSWPLDAGKTAHLGAGAWKKEAEMNYLCVLEEPIGHAGHAACPGVGIREHIGGN